MQCCSSGKEYPDSEFMVELTPKVEEQQSLLENSEEPTTTSLNDDTYSLPVALHFGGRPWYVVLLATWLAITIFLIQLNLMTLQVGQSVYHTVVNVDVSTRRLHLLFLFVNWGCFQIPILFAAQSLFLIGSPLGHTMAIIQIVQLFPIAYLSACVITEAVSAEDMIYRFMKLGMVMGMDNTIMSGIRAFFNYYMGADWLKSQCSWDVPINKASIGNKISHKLKYVLPGLFLLVTMFRAAETVGPTEFVYPLGKTTVFEDFFVALQDVVSYKPTASLNMTERCTGAEWRFQDDKNKVHLVPVVDDSMVAGASRVNKGLARVGVICQPEYAFVTEPTLFPKTYNFFAWILNLKFVQPEPGPIPQEYLPDGPAFKGSTDAGISLVHCGVCAANGMRCIKHGTKECDAAAAALGAKSVPGSLPKWAVRSGRYFSDRAKEVSDAGETKRVAEAFLDPMVALMDDFSTCNAKFTGLQAVKGWLIKTHMCAMSTEFVPRATTATTTEIEEDVEAVTHPEGRDE